MEQKFYFFLLFMLLPAGAVDFVVEARVVALEVRACVQDAVGDVVQVADVAWKPGHLTIVQHLIGAS